MTPIMSEIAAIFIIFLATQAQVFSAPTPCPMQEMSKVEEATDSSENSECRYSYLDKETLKDDIKTACRSIVGNCSIIHDKIFGRGSLVGHFCIENIHNFSKIFMHDS